MGRRIGGRRKQERATEKARQGYYRELEKARKRERARQYDEERKAADAAHKAEMESIRPTVEKLEAAGAKAHYIGHFWKHRSCHDEWSSPVMVERAFVLSESELLKLLERTDDS